ncbi:MAG: hypothetical protein D6702_12445 [Planctomycetota bacterium]|nr:MAG: hypothetical protein D6702_12445 [Planctomycetota bacterium]
MRRILALLPALLALSCTRQVVDQSFYAPERVVLVVELSGDEAVFSLPVEVESAGSFDWSWRQFEPELVGGREGPAAATVPVVSYAAAPSPPDLPAVEIGRVGVGRAFGGAWRARFNLIWREPRAGAVWTQRVLLPPNEEGAWTVDLGPHPLGGGPHSVSVRIEPEEPAGGSEAS